MLSQKPRGGGGGGGEGGVGVTLLFRGGGGCIHSLSKFENTTKALISGQKSTLIFKKRRLFPVRISPSFIRTLTLDEREHFRFYNPLPVKRQRTRKLLISFPITCPSLILAHTLSLINPVRFGCGTGVAHLVHTCSSTHPFRLGWFLNTCTRK